MTTGKLARIAKHDMYVCIKIERERMTGWYSQLDYGIIWG